MQALTHESTYTRRDPTGIIHRNRLAGVQYCVNRLGLGPTGSFAEFGCSNGFVMQTLQETVFAGKAWDFTGLDIDIELLEGGRGKGLPRTRFEPIDLNLPNEQLEPRFDVVMCVEVLEHVDQYENGLRTLFRGCKSGGCLLVGVPWEVGFPGTVKYLGRMALRGSGTYAYFFDRRTKGEYLGALLRGKPTRNFREPPRGYWDMHLGFDTAEFEHFLLKEYAPPRAELLFKHSTSAGFNRFWVFRKA